MKTTITHYMAAEEQIRSIFGCGQDIYLKIMPGYRWKIIEEEGLYILQYWLDEKRKTSAVIVRKNGAPFMAEQPDYAFVVAIECVKIGFVFEKENKIA